MIGCESGTESRLAVAKTSIVALLFCFSFLNYVNRTIMSIASPRMIYEFGISETEMGAVFSAFILGYALFMLPGGAFADRLGAKRALVIMGGGSAVFTVLTPLGGRPGLGALLGIVPGMVAIRFLMGVSSAPLYPCCARICSAWISEVNQGRVQGFVMSGPPWEAPHRQSSVPGS